MEKSGKSISPDRDLANEAVKELRKVLNAYADFNCESILLFSGGRDSSIVASAFCQAFASGKLHLFFMNNGVLHNQKASYRQYELIKVLYPNMNISFIEKHVMKIMNKAAMQEIERDFVEYKFSTLLVCVACKLILTYAVINYAKERGIKYVIDGSSVRQNHFPEQTEIFIRQRNKIFAENGLYCISPLYDFLSDKDKVVKTLNAFGIPDRQEPSCMFAHSFSEACEDEIMQHMNKSVRIIQRAMAEEEGVIR